MPKHDGTSKLIVPYTGRETGRIAMACEICGRQFQAVRRNRKYCSAYCRHFACAPKKAATERLCYACGKAFSSKQDRAKFCSARCTHRVWVSKNRARYNARMRSFQKKARKATPWYPLLGSARQRARDAKRAFKLTQDWARERWNGRCELTGIPFRVSKKHRTAFSGSIDRIDSRRGYTPDNCRFILWGLNLIKANGTDEELLSFIEQVHASIGHRG